MLHICKARGHESPKISRGGNMDPQSRHKKECIGSEGFLAALHGSQAGYSHGTWPAPNLLTTH